MRKKTVTTKKVAERFRIRPARVTVIAKERGIEPSHWDKGYHWFEDDVERLRPNPNGRPPKPKNGD